MNINNYDRTRLLSLEREIDTPNVTIWKRMNSLQYYIAIGVVFFIILYFFPPSFLLTQKSKKKPRKMFWLRWIFAWILCTTIVSIMLYMYYLRK